ncbi:toll-like receptor 13 [Mytilus californianus]|uniref:toll-like receptor 13 n=1 Tax=Mytilus californianus TaxID=6549 RepID=UPI002245A565|nr:toll-like receptor 13 [Mytilus californianus]
MSELCFALLMVVLCNNGSSSESLEEQLGILFNRSDLLCPEECEAQDYLNKMRFENSLECCTCKAQPLWTVDGSLNGKLNFTNVGHLNVFFVKHDIELKTIDHDVHFNYLIYTYGNLTAIPLSVCNFNTTVYIDLSFNQITDIRNISCLSILDTLLLAGNKIQSLIADIFNGMKHLRRVDVSFNQITKLEPKFFLHMADTQFERAKNYTFRIKEINLEENNFDSISEFFVSQLKSTTIINIKHNPLTSIDRSIGNFRPCNVQLGRLDIVCTCKDLWLQSWLPSSTMPCYNNTWIFCRTETGYKSITQITKSELGCTEDYHLKWFNLCIGIIVSLVVIFAFAGYNFYVEIYILWRRFLRKISRPVSRNSFQYDIYISCNEDDDGLRNWISYELLPHLNDRGLKSFLPYRDCQPGRPREEEVIDILSKSKIILVLLSDLHHLSRESTKAWISCEWKYAWVNYREDFLKNVIIINYDFLNNHDVSYRYIKAFMRASICIDFSNYKKDMWSTLNSLLGLSSPSYGIRYHRFQNSLDSFTNLV